MTSKNNKRVFIIVLEVGKYKIKSLGDAVYSEGPVPCLNRAVFSLCSHIVERLRDLCGISFVKA